MTRRPDAGVSLKDSLEIGPLARTNSLTPAAAASPVAGAAGAQLFLMWREGSNAFFFGYLKKKE